MSGQPSVDVQHLTKNFGAFTAVNDISFEVRPGEIFGFLGPNGAGKSTTIKMLCGIIAPSSGTGRVLDFDILADQDAIKTRIGYMSQKFSLYGDLTVYENLEFFGSIYGLSGALLAERMAYALEMAEIAGRKDAIVGSLPVGMKQRLALGGAILHDPPILFLDEPTSGVDPIMRRNFWELIYRFSEAGKTIFVTTHYMDEAEHCDRIALVIDGKIIALDTPALLKENLPYEVYALRVDNFIEVFGLVSGAEGIEEAAIFGSDIHLLCEKGRVGRAGLDRTLRGLGLSGFSLERIPPTLEDVFVTNARRFGL